MIRLVRNTVLCTAAAAFAGCFHIYEPKPTTSPATSSPPPAAAAAAKPPEDKGPFKAWDEVLKDSKPVDGFFKLHRKRDNTVFFELRSDQLEKDFGLIMHISKGTGVFNIQDGLPLSDSYL
ncbi:MAG TPA: hypothetical protein VGD49_00065, partial [Longimicrobiales bacterium]